MLQSMDFGGGSQTESQNRKEIQKKLVFEGAFEKIFSIIKEEGGSEGGGVVEQKYCIAIVMSSLEKPVGMDWLPSPSTIDLFQIFSSNGCSTSCRDT